jgi:hypothetical protein
MSLNRNHAGLALAAAVALTTSQPALAQVNVVGYWNPLVADEDFIERVPGPNVGDYAGLPITDAARKRVDPKTVIERGDYAEAAGAR